MIDLIDESDVKRRHKMKTEYPKIDIKVLKKSLDYEKYIERNYENRENCDKLKIDTLVDVDIGDISKIGYCCGVYVLITRSGRMYIGSSIDIKNRLSRHRSDQEYIFDPIESVIVYVTENIGDAKYLEMNLIRETKPDLNRIRYTNTVYNIKDVIKNLFIYSAN